MSGFVPVSPAVYNLLTAKLNSETGGVFCEPFMSWRLENGIHCDEACDSHRPSAAGKPPGLVLCLPWAHAEQHSLSESFLVVKEPFLFGVNNGF